MTYSEFIAEFFPRFRDGESSAMEWRNNVQCSRDYSGSGFILTNRNGDYMRISAEIGHSPQRLFLYVSMMLAAETNGIAIRGGI